MNYRALGRTGLVVSEIGFGAWGIGGRTVGQTSYGDTDDRTSLAALARALDCGITFFDTSAAYGNGHSEELIGEALARVRHEAVLATKAGYEAWDRPPDFSAAAIVASTERSLGSLAHRLRRPAPAAQCAARHAAGIRCARGAGGAWWPAARSGPGALSAKGPADALEALRACDVPVIQANFNMMDVRAVTGGLFAEVSQRNAGFIARTPLCFGFLSGTITRDTKFPPGDHRLGWSSAQLANWIDGAKDLLDAVSASPGPVGVQAALRFCLAFPEVSTTIPGILTPAEAGENAAASALGALPKDAVAAVLEINRNRQFFVAAAQAS